YRCCITSRASELHMIDTARKEFRKVHNYGVGRLIVFRNGDRSNHTAVNDDICRACAGILVPFFNKTDQRLERIDRCLSGMPDAKSVFTSKQEQESLINERLGVSLLPRAGQRSNREGCCLHTSG